MSLAHVCAGCGAPLTYVRPRRDPCYGLPLVICPACGCACVRRRHPLQSASRNARRALNSALALAIHVLVAMAFMFGTVAAIESLDSMLRHGTYLGGDEWLFVSLGILVPVATGVWLATGLSHWRRAPAFGAWAGVVTVALTLELWTSGEWGPGVLAIPARWPRSVAILAAMLVIATAGVPLGRALVRIWARGRRSRLGKRRARLRAARAGA